ncbi:TetR family transcriptional regulator [Sphingomonas profundi]|uniref:TetR family transcriptional regulator n=1 Tax=Alterirhizorhabdus profundi TaxID=2681549 RepID=UPI0012E91988|nr:TetR family transcriptional regulator [Sphingomonas profundi]
MSNRPGLAADRRNAVIDAAITEFVRAGFEATTVDVIARLAGVSRRTVFRYFAAKEDIVVAWSMATGPMLAAAIDAELTRRAPLVAATSAVLCHLGDNEHIQGLSLEVARLIEATPSLKARAHEKYAAWEELIADTLARQGADPIAAAMAATVAIGGLRVAVTQWLRLDGARSVLALTQDAYAALPRLNGDG